jgi:hypothetical protein
MKGRFPANFVLEIECSPVEGGGCACLLEGPHDEGDATEEELVTDAEEDDDEPRVSLVGIADTVATPPKRAGRELSLVEISTEEPVGSRVV